MPQGSPNLLNIPNSLTAFRVLSIPIVLWLYENGETELCLVWLVIALLTDFFDGWTARRFNQETHFGAIFDPIVDKFVALGFYGYAFHQGIIPIWFGAIILLRNFSQLMSVPILIWWLRKTFHVRPSRFAKWTTGFSDVFIFFPLFLSSFYVGFSPFDTIVLGLMVLLAIAELVIFVTYVPRLVAIATGKHDTFT